MKNFFLFLAIVCGGVSALLFIAAENAARGTNWASQVCKTAGSFCHSPQQLAFAAAGLGALWVVMIFVSAIRD
jgi:hypothetical protein